LEQDPIPKAAGSGTTWRDKVHPFFIHATEYYREITILSRSASPEDRAKAEELKRSIPIELAKEADQVERRGKLLAEIIGLDPNNPPPEYSDVPLDAAMKERFAFFRYRKNYTQLKDGQNWKALGEVDGQMWKAQFQAEEVDN